MIPYGRQDISEEDIEAVINVLRSDWITQGPALENFEKVVANYCGVRYAVAVSNATAALHIACLSLNLGEGDHLWTSPNTFVASANCGRYCGADVDFVDIDAKTYNLSVEALESKLRNSARHGTVPKVLVAVHFAGQSCEMAAIRALTQHYGVRLIEDASHAIGGQYLGKPVGCCEFSDLTVFSFHPVKIITTGEGGMVLTNQEFLYQKLIRLRTHGITRNTDLMIEPFHGPWYYQQLELGLNYRMTDIQAALGISQMNRLKAFIARRRQLAHQYNTLLADLSLTLPWQHPETQSSWHLYVVRLDIENIKRTHKQVFSLLRENGVGVNLHYIPVHIQPYYQSLGFSWGDFPAAEKYYREALTLPIHYRLTDIEQYDIVVHLKEILHP
jgi:UDP-4-amino-4,6-dideoxy-N-acetyl-beta-L-altrosamine transaminase